MKAAGKPVMESLQSDDSGPGAPLVAEAPASGTPGSRDPGAWLERLNDAQRDAVLFGTGDAPADGPLLVIAGAGSGKTNTLAHRVAHLVHESVRAAGPVSEHHEAERVGSHVNHGQAPLGAVAGERYAR
jgi:hypothetical protein